MWLVVLLLFLPSVANTEERNIHPNWAPRVWELRSDDITTIMGYRARLAGNLTHKELPGPETAKGASVYGFISVERNRFAVIPGTGPF
jgi:hypothetical protein